MCSSTTIGRSSALTLLVNLIDCFFSIAGVVSTDEQLSKLVFSNKLILDKLRLRSGSAVLVFHNAVGASRYTSNGSRKRPLEG